MITPRVAKWIKKYGWNETPTDYPNWWNTVSYYDVWNWLSVTKKAHINISSDEFGYFFEANGIRCGSFLSPLEAIEYVIDDFVEGIYCSSVDFSRTIPHEECKDCFCASFNENGKFVCKEKGCRQCNRYK